MDLVLSSVEYKNAYNVKSTRTSKTRIRLLMLVFMVTTGNSVYRQEKMPSRHFRKTSSKLARVLA